SSRSLVRWTYVAPLKHESRPGRKGFAPSALSDGDERAPDRGADRAGNVAVARDAPAHRDRPLERRVGAGTAGTTRHVVLDLRASRLVDLGRGVGRERPCQLGAQPQPAELVFLAEQIGEAAPQLQPAPVKAALQRADLDPGDLGSFFGA